MSAPYRGICTAQNDYDFYACREELRLLKECCKTKRGKRQLFLRLQNSLIITLRPLGGSEQ